MSVYRLGIISLCLCAIVACVASDGGTHCATHMCEAVSTSKALADNFVMLQSVVQTGLEAEDVVPSYQKDTLRVWKNTSAKTGLVDGYLVSGSSRYPSYMGLYTETSEMHAGRPIFKGNSSGYLCFRSVGSKKQWVIGPNCDDTGVIVSDSEASFGPEKASSWKERDTKTKSWLISGVKVDEATEYLRWRQHPKGKPVVKGTKVKFNHAGDLPQFLAGIQFNAFCVVVCVVFFMFMQRWYPLVYSFRALEGGSTAEFNLHPSPKTWSIDDKSWFGWVRVSLGTTSEEVEKTCGLDAAMFLVFLSFSMQLMTCIGLPMGLIMIPIYAFKGGGYAKDDRLSWIGINNVVYNETDFNGTVLSEEEVTMIPQVQWIYWMLAAAVWFVVVLTQCCILEHQNRFLKRKFEWNLSMPEPQCSTILVEGIPRMFASDVALTDFFKDKFGDEAVKEAFVMKRLTGSMLHELITDFCQREQRIHEIKFQMDLDPDMARPTINDGKDELEYLEAYQATAETQIVAEQLEIKRLAAQVAKEAPEQQMVTTATIRRNSRSNSISSSVSSRLGQIAERVDNFVDSLFENQALHSTNGFVIFHTRRDAEKTLGFHFSSNTKEWRLSHPPPPNDVIYRNLEVSDEWKSSQKFQGWLATAGLYFAFMPLVIAISNLTLLIVKVPFVLGFLEATGMKNIVLGLCSTIGLTIMMSFLPTLLSNIFTSFFPARSGGMCQVWVQQYYFWALILFVLLITAIGSDLTYFVGAVIRSPLHIFTLLAERMPGTTHFYLTYVALQPVIISMNLTRYMNLFKFIMYSHASSPQRAYELSEPEDQAYYGIGSRSARYSLLLAIGLVFGTICPLMNFVVLITFAMCRLVYGYLIPFAETVKNDLGGICWCKQMEHINFSLLIYLAMMTGILYHQAESRWPALVAGLCFLWWPLPLFELERGMRWKALEEKDLKEAETRTKRTAIYEYCQPELKWTVTTGKDPCKMHCFGLDDASFFSGS